MNTLTADAVSAVVMPRANRLARSLAKLERIPAFLRPWLRNRVMGRAVPFTGTAGLNFAEMSPEQVVITVPNVRRVQNHIQGVHAAAMALLAETATGMVVGMNVRDDCLPLCKTLHIDFKRRAQGGLRAVARLSAAQRELMQKNDKGEVSVLVQVSDESGEQPIQCEFIWAWIPTPKPKD
jgi:acyl-coenzyme A thioesterase PaaI-like protein